MRRRGKVRPTTVGSVLCWLGHLKRQKSVLRRSRLEGYLASDREAEMDRRIVEAYAREPQADLGASWAVAASIAAENWDEETSGDAARCLGDLSA